MAKLSTTNTNVVSLIRASIGLVCGEQGDTRRAKEGFCSQQCVTVRVHIFYGALHCIQALPFVQVFPV